MTNAELCRKLRDHASGLARRGNNLYRVRAFRQAALVVSGLPEDVATRLVRDGGKVLEEFPGIGPSLAQTIAGYVKMEESHPTQNADVRVARHPAPESRARAGEQLLAFQEA